MTQHSGSGKSVSRTTSRETDLPTGVVSEVSGQGATLQPRSRVGARYEILTPLGRGGMGEVWHAYDVKLRVPVALKALRPDIHNSEAAAEGLRREVRIAREVVSPNVCRIFDLVVEDGQEFISMEYIDGATLAVYLKNKGPLELGEARDIAAQFLAGLEAIHQAGLVHRDFKPENVMITRAGRVVVMDFGIARPVAQGGGTISGTPPYMAPELLSGGKVDGRSDIFAAGVVLAEMIDPEGVSRREAIWNAIREEPPRLAETPWQIVIRRAVAKNPENRFASAHALARALEEVTYRIETVEDKNPYPGLASFTEGDAEYFFGRELELETVLKKLQQLHFTALIGPSGAGKTSFLQAGLIPALPEGWSHILCQPGDAPLMNLAQALVPELSGDTEAMRKMLRFEDLSVALSILRLWREQSKECLLVVDRFEELFTLNSPDVQAKFAELLGRAPLETDVRILLAMRDDFLFRCHEYRPLDPLFSELTPLGSLQGPALRRALVQPALKCGYRYEDETLVDDMLGQLETERGALPLMAFAAARLWEKRDRKLGVLTREAYHEIGGVAGALAQHAEATMERIGAERQAVVREIFRHLITAQGTRCVRDAEELVSAFQDRKSVEEVLAALVDARLLTSFEAPQGEGQTPKRRVEIIHESLLSAWPRLVRWQTQDADGALLRDQLHQAAELWQQRGRPEELLWTGASYKDFEAWRERYSGGLTSKEMEFSRAMMQRAGKQRRRRRAAAVATFVVLLSVLGVIANFWRGAESAARRAEASKLLALGRLELDQDPTAALAYATKSLDLADTPIGRSFALEVLSKGPTASVVTQLPGTLPSDFSPDNQWLATCWAPSGHNGFLRRNGSAEEMPPETMGPALFAPDGDAVWALPSDPNVIRVWSVSKRREVRTLKMEGPSDYLVRGGRLFLFTHVGGEHKSGRFLTGTVVVRSWAFDAQEPRILGHLNSEDINTNGGFDIDKRGQWLAYTKGQGVYIVSIEKLETEIPRLLGEHPRATTMVAFSPNGNQVASSDVYGEIRLWSLAGSSRTADRIIPGAGSAGSSMAVTDMKFDSTGSILAASYFLDKDKTIHLWNLKGPSEADPVLLRRRELSWVRGMTFNPSGEWLAAGYAEGAFNFWHVNHAYPYVLHGEGSFESTLGFTPDGKWLVTDGASYPMETVRLWPLPGNTAGLSRELWKDKANALMTLDPLGRFIAVPEAGHTFLISLADGTTRQLPDAFGSRVSKVRFSPDGRLAAGFPESNSEIREISVLELETGKVQILPFIANRYPSLVEFSPDGSLLSGDYYGSLYRWNLNDRTYKVVLKETGIGWLAVSENARYLIGSKSSRSPDAKAESVERELMLYDLKEGTSRSITSHGSRVCAAAFDPAGAVLVTGDTDGIVRVGPISGETPHMLFEHSGPVFSVMVSPDGKWIASDERTEATVRLWPMPKGTPLQALPHDEFLDQLRALTNVRVVADKQSSTGYSVTLTPFPGWEKAPAW